MFNTDKCQTQNMGMVPLLFAHLQFCIHRSHVIGTAPAAGAGFLTQITGPNTLGELLTHVADVFCFTGGRAGHRWRSCGHHQAWADACRQVDCDDEQCSSFVDCVSDYGGPDHSVQCPPLVVMSASEEGGLQGRAGQGRAVRAGQGRAEPVSRHAQTYEPHTQSFYVCRRQHLSNALRLRE